MDIPVRNPSDAVSVRTPTGLLTVVVIVEVMLLLVVEGDADGS
jgi:hypothetical protein